MTQDPESQRIADEFHGLLFPPNPRARANMERLWQMVGEAVRLEIAHYRHGIIKDAHGADVEDNGYCNEHYPVLYGRSRLLDRQAGPPADGWVWQEDFDSRLQDDDDTANAEVQYKRAKESLKLQGIRKPTDKQCYAWARKSVETAPPPFKQWRFNIRPGGGAWVPPELAGEEPPAILTDEPLQKVALMGAYLKLVLLHDQKLTATGKQLLSADERYPVELKPSLDGPFVAYHHGPIEWMEGMKRPDVALEAVKDDLAALAADAAEQVADGDKTGDAKPGHAFNLSAERRRVLVDGQWFDLTDLQTQALTVLMDAQGAYVKGENCAPEMSKQRKTFPAPVAALIETQKGPNGGFRLKPQLFE